MDNRNGSSRALRYVLTAITFLVILATTATAQYNGISAYAAMHRKYPCAKLLATTSGINRPAIAVVWGTFGNSTTCLTRFIRQNKNRDHAIEIHFENGVFRRRGIQRYDPFLPNVSRGRLNAGLVIGKPEILSAYLTRANEIKAFLDSVANEHTKVYISLALEDNLSPQAAIVARWLITSVLPYDIVRNSVNPADCSGGDICETHTYEPDVYEEYNGHCIWNGDGMSPRGYEKNWQGPVLQSGLGGIRQWVLWARSRGCTAFVWFGKHQGLQGRQFVLPVNRRYVYDVKDIAVIKHLLRD